jgi:hypothetical protein
MCPTEASPAWRRALGASQQTSCSNGGGGQLTGSQLALAALDAARLGMTRHMHLKLWACFGKQWNLF